MIQTLDNAFAQLNIHMSMPTINALPVMLQDSGTLIPKPVLLAQQPQSMMPAKEDAFAQPQVPI